MPTTPEQLDLLTETVGDLVQVVTITKNLLDSAAPAAQAAVDAAENVAQGLATYEQDGFPKASEAAAIAGTGEGLMTAENTRKALIAYASLLSFGALFYGNITDNAQIAINTATLQAAFDSGYGRIRVPAEIIVLDKLTITNRWVSLVAEFGDDGTVGRYPTLKLKPNATAGTFITVAGANTQIHLDTISLDGNKANQVAVVHGIEATSAGNTYSNSIMLDNALVRNFSGDGVRADKNRNSGQITNRSLISNNNGYGVKLLGLLDWKLSDCDIVDNGLSNIYADQDSTGATCDAIFMVNVFNAGAGILGTADAHGVLVGQFCRSLSIIGGSIDRSGRNAVRVVGDVSYNDRMIQLIGGRYAYNSAQNAGVYSDIYTESRHLTMVGTSHLSPGVAGRVKHILETNYSAGSVRAKALGTQFLDSAFVTGFTNVPSRIDRDHRYGMQLDAGSILRWVNTDDNTRIIESVGAGGGMGFRSTALGAFRWGDGTAAEDTLLFRSAAGRLQMDALNSFRAPGGFGANVRAAAPTDPWIGMICLADRVNWDPKAIGSGGPYMVWWNGTVWRYVNEQ